ncbi:MAG TPA: TonB family protein [Verrucomicrobiae bacterium]|nr:TonB family protein [Verrucomicrobiae bacterium]
MATVGPPLADDDLHLLYEWHDPFAPARRRAAGVASILVHVAAIIVIVILPPDFLVPPPEPPPERKHEIVTPLIAPPLTEFTQKEPTKGKVNREIDMASLQARAPIHAPPAAPRPAVIPPAPAPKAPAPALPEPPKIETALNNAPKIDLPPSPSTVPPPQIQTVEKPRMVLENVGGPPPAVPPGQSKIPIPTSGTVSDAIRQSSRGGVGGGGVVVGDPGALSGIGEGINQSGAPGVPGAALQLKSDSEGVDFRPYLAQILVAIKRNWLAVYPESARLGRRGKVGLIFIISKSGGVNKVTWAYQSGTDALDRAAVAAISASTPFPPLPTEFKGSQVILQLNFAYNMPK